MTDYLKKYLKYKQKYLELQKQYAGRPHLQLNKQTHTVDTIIAYINKTDDINTVDLDAIEAIQTQPPFLQNKDVLNALITKNPLYLKKSKVQDGINKLDNTNKKTILELAIDKNIKSLSSFTEIKTEPKEQKKEYYKYAIEKNLDALQYIDIPDLANHFEDLYNFSFNIDKNKTIYILRTVSDRKKKKIFDKLAIKMNDFATNLTYKDDILEFEKYIKKLPGNTEDKMRPAYELFVLAIGSDINRFIEFPLFDLETQYILNMEKYFIKNGNKVVLKDINGINGYIFLRKNIMRLLIQIESAEQAKNNSQNDITARATIRKNSNMFFLDKSEEKLFDKYEQYLQETVKVKPVPNIEEINLPT